MAKRPGTVIGIGDHSIELTSEHAVMYPADGITKGDLCYYFLEIAATILPYLEDRALTVERFQSGIHGKGFIQKQASERYPGWIRREIVPSRSHPGDYVEHVVCDDAATLVFLANQRCVVLHVGPTRVDRLDYPDQLIFDFDPPDASPGSFDAVRDGARRVGELVRSCGLTPFVKTSGSKGLHVIAPLDRQAHVDEARAFARAICDRIAAQEPARFTTSIAKSDRVGKVFLDYLRNGHAQTLVAPYSPRAIDGAPVSTPITWEELEDPALSARTFTVKNVRQRLATSGDPWRGMGRFAGSLDAASAALDDLR